MSRYKIVMKATVILMLSVLLVMVIHGCSRDEPQDAGDATERAKEQSVDTTDKEAEMVKLEVGDTAPGFSLLDQDGREVSLGDFAGKKVLLYFYPRADTPGCTKQACSVRDSSAELAALGIVGIGMSPDKPEAQKKFDEKYDLGFKLLSDADHKIAEAYGAWGEKKKADKTTMSIIRSSFLINESGDLTGVWYSVKPDETVPNATAAVSQQ